MNLEKMQNVLSMQQIPPAFSDIYPRIADTWQDHAASILSDDYITKTLDDCYALASYRTEILQSAQRVRQNPAMCLLVCLLEQWLREGGRPTSAVYTPPVGTDPAFDFLHLFPAIPTMPDSVAYLRQRKVPEDIIAASMQEYDSTVANRKLSTGKPGLTAGILSWLCCVINNELIHIGCLKYNPPCKCLSGVRVYEHQDGTIAVLADNVQVHASGRVLGSVGHTDPEGSFLAEIQTTESAVIGYPVVKGFIQKEPVTLPKAQWSLKLSPDDLLARVHIPRGGVFNRETIESSYQRAREIFVNCYPDRPLKGFHCCTWLLADELQTILKPTSNILAFQEPYIKIPTQTNGREAFSFVFPGCRTDAASIPTWPENTNLQRSIKQLYLDGGYLHEGTGFFF